MPQSNRNILLYVIYLQCSYKYAYHVQVERSSPENVIHLNDHYLIIFGTNRLQTFKVRHQNCEY